MQHGEGLISKAPRYIEEKFNTAMHTPFPEHGLDPESLHLYAGYMKKWIQPLQDSKTYLEKLFVLDE